VKQYSLDFCDFFHHDNGILEIVAHEGIEVTADMAHEFLDTVNSIEPKVVAALVNRKNNYSYTFAADIIFAKSKVVKYLAIVKYGKFPWPLKGTFFPKFYSLAFFDNVDEAMKWLLLKIN